MTKKQRKIVEAWDAFETAEPDISTERLLQMVMDSTGADAFDIGVAMMQAQNADKGGD